MVTINIKKKDLFLITAVVVFLIGAGAIIAYNPGGTANPSVLGHSANEISGMIVGGCSFACDKGSANFAACTGTWGAGNCASGGGTVCQKSPSRCSCSSGTLTYIGNDQSWSSAYQFDTMRLQFLCINP